MHISEGYNDVESIDEVSAWEDGKRNKTVTPKYDYYSINDVFYSDARICYFNLELNKKGSSVETEFEKTLTDPKYFTTVFLTDDYNIRSGEI